MNERVSDSAFIKKRTLWGLSIICLTSVQEQSRVVSAVLRGLARGAQALPMCVGTAWLGWRGGHGGPPFLIMEKQASKCV